MYLLVASDDAVTDASLCHALCLSSGVLLAEHAVYCLKKNSNYARNCGTSPTDVSFRAADVNLTDPIICPG